MTFNIDPLAADESVPQCPTCGSQGRRCIQRDGSLAWPWHIRRIVAFDAQLLADKEWVAAGHDDSLGTARLAVAAYLAGIEDGYAASVIDADAAGQLLPDATESLKRAVLS